MNNQSKTCKYNRKFTHTHTHTTLLFDAHVCKILKSTYYVGSSKLLLYFLLKTRLKVYCTER